ncbi:Acetoin utilization deacetylase AcuC [Fervidobacterium changbaicum]|uniref:Histone deacetylase family protein n=1 Tax=Fervidobacterium changbaicum TaxID=310769 RepID=A0ABX5QQP0_9BACT|nr:histone deacetylase family protein [Fervidobacterium changbaicum]QAV32719.1 histone deacetylase family protein [Fervidobacterium changbaicum]SDG98140.1 Acetoin utilization deacetylase AcuC [Fervidobacterium changbaicum]
MANEKKASLYFCAELNEYFIPKKEIDNGRFIRNPERPSRLKLVLDYIQERFQEIQPTEFSEEHILKVHSEKYFNYIVKKSQEVDEEYLPEVFFVDPIFDTGTPIRRETFSAAKRAVDVVLSATKYAVDNKTPTYALTRPPGHHAMTDFGGGYCYFNNVAIAAKFLEEKGMRIAILDLDFHHGNGTQDIFYKDPNVLYVSIHGDPKRFYPWFSGYETERGEGKAYGTNLNIPLPGNTDIEMYKEALKRAIQKIQDFKPDALMISLGTDTHVKDPVGKFSLLSQDFKKIGVLITSSLEIDYLVIVHEGGYNPKSNLSAVKNFLAGLFGD